MADNWQQVNPCELGHHASFYIQCKSLVLEEWKTLYSVTTDKVVPLKYSDKRFRKVHMFQLAKLCRYANSITAYPFIQLCLNTLCSLDVGCRPFRTHKRGTTHRKARVSISAFCRVTATAFSAAHLLLPAATLPISTPALAGALSKRRVLCRKSFGVLQTASRLPQLSRPEAI